MRLDAGQIEVVDDIMAEVLRHKTPAERLRIGFNSLNGLWRTSPVDSPFNTSRFTRSRQIYPSVTYHANFAAPEDVIIKKMEYYKEGGSEKHLRDITGILKVSGDDIDYGYISEWAERLGLTEIWQAINDRISKKI